MAKHMCTDHEELYKNLLKPQMKVGNELVAQVSNKKRVNTLMQSPPIMPDI
jgi:myosin heavy subunit